MYRILIVEDEQTIARAVAEELSHWGLESRCVENFRDVMVDFQAFQPQLVLLDIMLPFFNGYHWCNEIRKCSNAPIIFLSSASDNMNIVMAMNMGGDDFIAKPFDRTVLVAKVVGCILPMLAKKIGFDPAVMASPFITTIVDALSLLIYFGIASTLLPGISG